VNVYGLNVHKDINREAKHKLTKMTADAKLSHYKEKIMNGCQDQKSLFAFLNKVCHRKQVILLDQSAADQLVSSFNDFSVQKIKFIQKCLNEQADDPPPNIPEVDTDEAVSSLTSSTPVFVQNVDIIPSVSGSTVIAHI